MAFAKQIGLTKARPACPLTAPPADGPKDLDECKIGFETLDGLSTRGPHGRLTLGVLGAIAQLERELMLERTMVGLAAARADGHVSGRRRKLTPEDVVAAHKHMTSGLKAREVANLSGRSLWRSLRWAAELEEVRAG